MARLLRQFIEHPRECSYLPDQSASLESLIMVDVSQAELEARLVRGYRRFGADYFRPACLSCSQCLPTRVPVASFRPSKSQRRARKACAGLFATVGPPRVDRKRLALYHLWHGSREVARGWKPMELDERAYYLTFAMPHVAAREIAYYDGHPKEGRLVGVAICDETPGAWSAIYFFYHPDWAERSIGTANVLIQIEVARQRKIPYVYLGYTVLGCPSMRYKQRFLPQERLVGWPAMDEEPTWVSVEEAELP